MRRRELTNSGYQGMWPFALFDLPVETKQHWQSICAVSKIALREGFSMLQFSVDGRYCTERISNAFRRRVRKQIPDDGQIRLVAITDRQFGKMEVYGGKKRLAAEQPPDQLLLF